MTWQNPQNTAQYPYSVPKTPSPTKPPQPAYPGSDMYTTSYIPGTNTGGAKTPYPSAPEAPSQATMKSPLGSAPYQPNGSIYAQPGATSGPSPVVNYDQLTPSNPYTMASPSPSIKPGDPYWSDAAAGGNYEYDVGHQVPSNYQGTPDPYYNPGGDRRNGLYDPNLPGNAPAPSGWPSNLPRPPTGVLPGTPAYSQWLEANGIDKRSPLNEQIKQQLFMESMGGVSNPADSAPWAGTTYDKYMQGYLDQLGLGVGDAPPGFDQGLYDQIYGGIMGDATRGGQMAAGYIEDFDPTQAAGFDTLSQYMDMQSGYLDKYGGYMGFDPEGLQNAGLAQSEIARAAAERSMGNQIASAGLTGQANSAYMSAPMYADYLNSRINAVQNPVMAAAQLGNQGVGTTMGALTDLYGLGQNADIARAGAFGDLYGRGLGVAAGTGAQVGLGAAGNNLDAFLQMQQLYGGFPMQGYGADAAAQQMWNDYMLDMYGQSTGQSNESKDRKNRRKQTNIQKMDSIRQGTVDTAGTVMDGFALGMA